MTRDSAGVPPRSQQEDSLARVAAGAAVLVAAALFMLWRSWLTWPDLLVDFGQQLYVPWRLVEGEVLYRDIAYLHGPLSSYLHAAVMRAWGVRLDALIAFNLMVVALLVLLLYRLLVEHVSRFAAEAACLFFVVVFAVGQYVRLGIFNYLCPYTYDITHGVTLALAAVYAFQRYALSRAGAWLATAGGLLGLVFLTKVEVFVAVAGALALGGLLLGWTEKRGAAARLRPLLLLGACALAAPAIALGLLSLAMPPGQAFSALLSPYAAALDAEARGLLFFRTVMGVDRPWDNLVRLAIAASWYVMALAPAMVAGWALRRVPRAAGLALAAAPLIFLAFTLRSTAWFQAARPLPLFIAVVGGAAAWALYRERRGSTSGRSAPETGRRVAWLTLVVFAGLLLAKIVLYTRLYHYGFVLAMPATMVCLVAGLDRFPAWIESRGGTSTPLRWAVATVVILAMVAHGLRSDDHYRKKTHWVGEGGDAFLADARGQAVGQVLTFLAERGDATLVSFPDGLMVNYLARAPSTVPYVTYAPIEVEVFGEATMLRDLQARPPDLVLLVEKSNAAFGYRYFGTDYATDLMGFVREGYRPVGTVGATPLTGEGFGLQLWARAAGPEARR